MKKGLLLYTEVDAAKNKWFIEHLIENFKKYDIELNFAIFEHYTPENDAPYDFCINRTRYDSINTFYESRGVRCFNNSATVSVANDKWLTFDTCRKLGIPVIDTELITDTASITLSYPYIVKSRNGHGGSEVFWVNNEDDLKSLSLANNSGYIAQKPVSDLGVDVRIYVLGGHAIAGVKRTSASDFRSNYSLGGKVELFTPTDAQLEIIEKLQGAIATDYAGFDFIPHNGSWVLNEIEDAVGARMLYSLCNFDVGEDFVKYIYDSLSL